MFAYTKVWPSFVSGPLGTADAGAAVMELAGCASDGSNTDEIQSKAGLTKPIFRVRSRIIYIVVSALTYDLQTAEDLGRK